MPPRKILANAEREIILLEQARASVSPDPSVSDRPSVGTVFSDPTRMFVSVDNIPMGRVINRKFLFTPSGIDRYSVENRGLAEMAINNM